MEPFILTTDWSVLNLGGLLSQIQEGVELLSVAGAGGETMKGELLALVKSMERWNQ